MQELAEWGNFYLVVGGAAGALIGLQFVVLTLITQRPPEGAVSEAGSAFATPTIVHFSASLFLSALLLAPWRSIAPPATIWGILGVAGTVYVLLIAAKMRSQTVYQPAMEDWLFHLLLPLAAYGSLLASAFASSSYTRNALFAVGGSALLFLFIGIHNSWDAVTYHIFHKKTAGEAESAAIDASDGQE